MVVPPAGRATPELVKRIRGVFRPEPGCTWDLSMRTTDPPLDPALKHGIKTVSSHKVCIEGSSLWSPDIKECSLM